MCWLCVCVCGGGGGFVFRCRWTLMLAATGRTRSAGMEREEVQKLICSDRGRDSSVGHNPPVSC